MAVMIPPVDTGHRGETKAYDQSTEEHATPPRNIFHNRK